MIRGNLLARFIRYASAVFVVVTLDFFLIRLMPGDPLIHLLGEQNFYYLHSYAPDDLEKARIHYGLDQPFHVQYLKHLSRTLRGDMGWTSHYERPVLDVILFRLKWTLVLLLPAAVVSIGGGGLLGVPAGWRWGKLTDRLSTAVLLLLHCIPAYCLGMILLVLLSLGAGLFPTGGMMSGPLAGVAGFADLLHHMALPFATLVLCGSGSHYLVMRSAVREASSEDYVLTGFSMGLSCRRILLRHVLPNALPPLATMAALEFGFLVGGALLVEMVFSWQGMGTLIQEAVLSRDYPLLSGCLLVLTLCVIAANGVADLACAVIDPRVGDGATDAVAW